MLQSDTSNLRHSVTVPVSFPGLWEKYKFAELLLRRSKFEAAVRLDDCIKVASRRERRAEDKLSALFGVETALQTQLVA